MFTTLTDSWGSPPFRQTISDRSHLMLIILQFTQSQGEVDPQGCASFAWAMHAAQDANTVVCVSRAQVPNLLLVQAKILMHHQTLSLAACGWQYVGQTLCHHCAGLLRLLRTKLSRVAQKSLLSHFFRCWPVAWMRRASVATASSRTKLLLSG